MARLQKGKNLLNLLKVRRLFKYSIHKLEKGKYIPFIGREM